MVLIKTWYIRFKKTPRYLSGWFNKLNEAVLIRTEKGVFKYFLVQIYKIMNADAGGIVPLLRASSQKDSQSPGKLVEAYFSTEIFTGP